MYGNFSSDYFAVTEEDIFGDDTGDSRDTSYIRDLEENAMLFNENRELKKELDKLRKDMEVIKLQLQQTRQNKTPAYRNDINIDELFALYDKNQSVNKIAKTLGCSPHTVKRRLKELGKL